jgi:hypothetical protein
MRYDFMDYVPWWEGSDVVITTNSPPIPRDGVYTNSVSTNKIEVSNELYEK